MLNTIEKNNMTGQLYVVATPIGNLGDISQRAKETLEKVDLIAVEDTRHTGKLLAHLGIKKPMQSLHAHNERARTEKLIDLLQTGGSVALVSDAGTPLISDPGFPLIRAAQKADIKIIPIPGPSAVIAALTVAGLPCDRFIFEGFLPAKSKARLAQLKTLTTETRTLVFYESPHRIEQTITDMLAVFGAEREAVIARELTKTFEQIKQAPLAELQAWLQDSENHRRGEFVVLVKGREEKQTATEPEINQLLKILLEELPLKQAAKIAAKISGEPKNKLYELALNFRQKDDR